MNNMAFARQFGQGASPWSAGMPPGIQQQQQPQPNHAPMPQQHQGSAQVPQQMFNQPMGAFDITTGGGGGGVVGATGPSFAPAGQMAPAHGQWAQPMQAMQAPVQFVPNSGAMFMQQQPMQPPQMQQRFHPQQQQQRPMHHQRSLSASRVGFGNQSQSNKRAYNNQNNSFGGSQWQPNNNSRQQNNNTNTNNEQQSRRSGRQQQQQQARQQQNPNQQQQKGQQQKASNNNNKPNKQQQQQQQKQQQQQGPNKGPVKVTKAAKKQAVAKANKVVKPQANASDQNNKAENKAKAGANNNQNQRQQKKQKQQQQQKATNQQQPSKTAERKQMKLQARKNAESLKLKQLPINRAAKVGGVVAVTAASNSDDANNEAQIDQLQLKCVPAVFGFVCKACDVFLRDRNARREHIDSDSHMEKFKVFEAEQKKLEEQRSAPSNEVVKSEPQSDATAAIEANNNESADVKSVDVKPDSAITNGDDAVVEPAAEAKVDA